MSHIEHVVYQLKNMKMKRNFLLDKVHSIGKIVKATYMTGE